MQKERFLIVALLTFVFSFPGCTGEEGGVPPMGHTVSSEAVSASFEARFPGVESVDWSRKRTPDLNDKENYYVADFNWNEQRLRAWFTEGGDWRFTLHDLDFDTLNDTIRKAFAVSAYTDWKLTCSHLLERSGMGSLYALCTWKNGTHLDVYYSEQGDLVKVVDRSGDEEEYPIRIPEHVSILTNGIFHDAQIIDIWEGYWGLNIALLQDGGYHLVLLDAQDRLLGVSHNIPEEEAPQPVRKAFKDYMARNGKDCHVDSCQRFYFKGESTYLYNFVSEQGHRRMALIEASGRLRCIMEYK
ncbi:MAG: PepSY-like domain-containing protein [Tannerella sp.]|jgi:hypothetical protein|nr:PepSY-like domain-containing protein [Tannerella sp.]